MQQTIQFKILHLDNLGQGVHKAGGNIYFIPHTLPTEQGVAQIIRQKKGVHFCQLISITHPSPIRVEPNCPHYQQCQGCHYLHTSYEFELEHKKQQFKRLLTQCNYHSAIEVIAAEHRLNYRTRIQLHYDFKHKQIGYKDQQYQIIEVPHCQLPVPNIQDVVTTLYQKDFFTDTSLPPQGHLELLEYQNQVEIFINKPYAARGFSQVNTSQNQKCLTVLHNFYQDILPTGEQWNILDLFGGNGNLSQMITQHPVLVVDYASNQKMPNSNHSYLQADIFKPTALERILLQQQKFDLLILDPPRSGLKTIDQYTKSLSPKFIAYLSCNPMTLIRDLKKITPHYSILKVYLLDFFPATYHWESLVLLQR